MTEYFQALLASVTIRVIVPLSTLLGLFVFIAWLINKAQKSPDFRIQECLIDEKGKVSSRRIVGLFAFAISSWVLMVQVINVQDITQTFFYYLAFWSGLLVASKWDGKLPFAKGD